LQFLSPVLVWLLWRRLAHALLPLCGYGPGSRLCAAAEELVRSARPIFHADIVRLQVRPDDFWVVVVDGVALVVGEVVEDWRRDDDSLWQVSHRLESHHVCSVLDDLEFSGVDVDVAVLALDEAVGVTSLELEGTVGGLVPVGVRTVFIVSGKGGKQMENKTELHSTDNLKLS
jgi:hypothetical protein